MKRLTEREREVLTFIVKYREEKGYSPSTREICKGCYLASTNSASYYINQLVIKGAIEYTPKVARSIRPTEKTAI